MSSKEQISNILEKEYKQILISFDKLYTEKTHEERNYEKLYELREKRKALGKEMCKTNSIYITEKTDNSIFELKTYIEKICDGNISRINLVLKGDLQMTIVFKDYRKYLQECANKIKAIQTLFLMPLESTSVDKIVKIIINPKYISDGPVGFESKIESFLKSKSIISTFKL